MIKSSLKKIYLLIICMSLVCCKKNDEIKEDFFKNLFTDLVQNGEYQKVGNYFSSDAKINLDGKLLNYEEFVKRVQWMQKRDMKVDFKQAIISGNKAASFHYSTIKDGDASSTFKVFAWMELKNGKVINFEHIALKIEGNAPQSVVNDF